MAFLQLPAAHFMPLPQFMFCKQTGWLQIGFFWLMTFILSHARRGCKFIRRKSVAKWCYMTKKELEMLPHFPMFKSASIIPSLKSCFFTAHSSTSFLTARKFGLSSTSLLFPGFQYFGTFLTLALFFLCFYLCALRSPPPLLFIYVWLYLFTLNQLCASAVPSH